MTEEMQSGMPKALRDYWVRGEGAAKIRWGTSGSFDRCVRALRGVDGVRDPEGTCANLHHEATGKWPTEGKDLSLEELTASMGVYSPVTWSGPLAPIGKPTGDRRIFPPGRLGFQTFPAPLRFQREGMDGHKGAVTVGRILHAEEGTWNGEPYIIGHGDFFNPQIIPEVTEAMALIEGGVAGPSVDLDSFTGRPIEVDGRAVLMVAEGRVRAATLVAIPAFADLRLELSYPQPVDESVEDTIAAQAETLGEEFTASLDAWESALLDTPVPDGAPNIALIYEMGQKLARGFTEEFAASVNATGWRGAPVAPRDAEFDADDAVSRIEQYAGVGTESPDEAKMRKMFLWVDPEGAPLDRAGYRLPWGDIIDGKPYLIYHAIYAAAALLEGGHGGLPNIPDADKARLRSVISTIYEKLATEFGDPNVKASWDRAAEKAEKAEKASGMGTETFAIQGGFGDMPIAKGDPTWDKGAALRELDAWAGDDMSKYRRAFLYREDGADPELKGSYKFPVARPVDGTLTVIPAAVRNAAARVSGADVSDKEGLRAAIESLMNRIHKMEASLLAEYGAFIEDQFADLVGLQDFATLTDARPAAGMFADPQLTRPTKPRIVDGRYFGHLALWETCHLGFDGVCVTPVPSKQGYRFMKAGTFTTAEGETVEISKIMFDGQHAATRRGLTAAAVKRFYEDTTKVGGLVRIYPDRFGIAFSGIPAPWLSETDRMRLQASEISGHWHPIDGHLELLAAIAVNRSGFPITASGVPQLGGDVIVLMEGDTQTGLIASAVFDTEETDCGCEGEDSERERRIARLAGHQPLPTQEEIRARTARLAAHLG